MVKKSWWIYAAGLIGVAMVFFGVGNLFGGDDGPLYGKIVAAAAAVGFAGLIMAGLVIRESDQRKGSMLVGFGVLPATLLVTLFWFPPVAAVGLLAIFVAWRAFSDGTGVAATPEPAKATEG
ncbi:MAG: hypothetical protein ACR2OI_10130 [Acidimicrobiia bacterium]